MPRLLALTVTSTVAVDTNVDDDDDDEDVGKRLVAALTPAMRAFVDGLIELVGASG